MSTWTASVNGGRTGAWVPEEAWVPPVHAAVPVADAPGFTPRPRGRLYRRSATPAPPVGGFPRGSQSDSVESLAASDRPAAAASEARQHDMHSKKSDDARAPPPQEGQKILLRPSPSAASSLISLSYPPANNDGLWPVHRHPREMSTPVSRSGSTYYRQHQQQQRPLYRSPPPALVGDTVAPHPSSSPSSPSTSCTSTLRRRRSFGEETPLLLSVAMLHPLFAARDALDAPQLDRSKKSSPNGLFGLLLLLLLLAVAFGVSLLGGTMVSQPLVITASVMNSADLTVMYPLRKKLYTPEVLGELRRLLISVPDEKIQEDELNNVLAVSELIPGLYHGPQRRDNTVIAGYGRFRFQVVVQSLTTLWSEVDFCSKGCVVYGHLPPQDDATATAPPTTAITTATGTKPARDHPGGHPTKTVQLGSFIRRKGMPFHAVGIATFDAEIITPPSEEDYLDRLCQDGYARLSLKMRSPAVYLFSGVTQYPPVLFGPFLFPCFVD